MATTEMLHLVAAFVDVPRCQISGSVAIAACDRVPFSEVRFGNLTYFIAVPPSEIIDAGPNPPDSQGPLELGGSE